MSLLESAAITCPYCWEHYTVSIDPSVGDTEYVEDCIVCCRPIVLSVVQGMMDDASPDVHVRREND